MIEIGVLVLVSTVLFLIYLGCYGLLFGRRPKPKQVWDEQD